MADSSPPEKPEVPDSARHVIDRVEQRAVRIIRAKSTGSKGFWRSAAMVGLIGWTVVIPMLIGIAIGTWIDRTWPSRFSWTLMLLVGGLGAGCVSAWTRIRDEQERR